MFGTCERVRLSSFHFYFFSYDTSNFQGYSTAHTTFATLEHRRRCQLQQSTHTRRRWQRMMENARMELNGTRAREECWVKKILSYENSSKKIRHNFFTKLLRRVERVNKIRNCGNRHIPFYGSLLCDGAALKIQFEIENEIFTTS